MNVAKVIVLVVMLFTFALSTSSHAVSLSNGITIGDWLDNEEDVLIQTTRYQKVDFEAIHSLGADHVRILVNFNTPATVSPDYALSAVHYACLDKALMWAEELGLSIVITNSEEEITDGTADPTKERLMATWKLVATRYAAKGDMLAYELFHAPGNLITAETWNGVAAAVITAIREADANHPIIVGSVNNYSVDELANLSKFDDANVIYAFQFYEPVLFTYQGAAHLEVDYNTNVVPFPYNAGTMPEMAEGGDGADIAEAAYNAYATEGNVDFVKSRLDVAAQAATDKAAPVYCAGFATHIGDGSKTEGWLIPQADRTAWLETVRGHMDEKSLGWAYSDYRGGMGIFDNYNYDPDIWMQNSAFPYDVNTATCTALGLTPPDITSYWPEPLTEGFTIYDDEVNPAFRFSHWFGDDSEVSLMNTEDPISGQYCLSLFYLGQWQAADFFLPLIWDMSQLADDGYLLDFFVRSYQEDSHIQARFEDANEDFDERPWRMNYHVDNNVVPFDGEWQRVTIPLIEMEDQGAWDPDDRTWYGGGTGMQDWSTVQRLQFVSETAAQPDAEIFLDRIRIVHPSAVEGRSPITPEEMSLADNYPNPFNPSTVIEFTLPAASEVQVAVYNVRGELVKSLLSAKKSVGVHQVNWDGTNAAGLQAPSGVYFYQLSTEQQNVTKQMLLIR